MEEDKINCYSDASKHSISVKLRPPTPPLPPVTLDLLLQEGSLIKRKGDRSRFYLAIKCLRGIERVKEILNFVRQENMEIVDLSCLSGADMDDDERIFEARDILFMTAEFIMHNKSVRLFEFSLYPFRTGNGCACSNEVFSEFLKLLYGDRYLEMVVINVFYSRLTTKMYDDLYDLVDNTCIRNIVYIDSRNKAIYTPFDAQEYVAQERIQTCCRIPPEEREIGPPSKTKSAAKIS